jgi:hypothetical protein
MPSPVIARARRLALGLGGAAAIALCSAPAASADFSINACAGDGIFGRGASFAGAAIGGFAAVLRTDPPNGCGATSLATVSYDPAGSGAGRRSLGSREGNNLLL